MTAHETRQMIRIGVLGIARGATFAKDSDELGIKLVAVCDINEARLNKFKQGNKEVAIYTDYDQFLQHDIDAVVVANYFHQHAPFAIKALRAGKHVLSEVSACKTVQEGVELIREVEKSGKIYMLSENYPYFSVNQEMCKLYKQGAIGDVKYAEGEYVHPMPYDLALAFTPTLDHWRNYCPSTYYCTHSLAPLMYMTDTMPVSVNALSITDPEQEKTKVKRGDPSSVILCRMDNGAVFRLIGGGLAGKRYYYRLHGFKGMMEVAGPITNGNIRIVRNEWELGHDEAEETVYKTKFPSHEGIAKKAGHGGGDFWVRYHFAESIRTGQQPYLDVYRGVAMTIVGILAWKSALQNGDSFEVPDLSKEEVRKLHENDDWSPWPEDRRPGQPWSSIRGEIIPSEEAVANAQRVWSEQKSIYDR